MGKITIRDVKRNIAAAFPDIDFSYGPDTRRGCHGHRISWVGGPIAETVRRLSGAPVFQYRNSTTYHFSREHTPDEWKELERQWDADRAAREAAEPARRAAAKQAGIDKRHQSAKDKKRYLVILADAFPFTPFTLTMKDGTPRCAWVDGPELGEITALIPISPWQCTRRASPEGAARVAAHRAAEVKAIRLRRRLEASRLRALAIQTGIARRARQHARVERESRQMDMFV